MNDHTRSDHKTRTLRDKTFTERKSLLTELLEVKHFKTIRHMFIAVLFGFLCHDAVNVLFSTGETSFGFRLIKIGFAKFHVIILVWLLQFGCNLLTYAFFKYWANLRQQISSNYFSVKCWDKFWLAIFLSYYFGALYVTAVLVFKLDLPVLCSCIVIAEQIRLLMKSHAFVRSNAPKVLNQKLRSEDALVLPPFSKYVYFSFAPTLIYRDEYPRTKDVNWKYATMCFVEVFVLIWLQSFVFDKCFAKKFEFTGIVKIDWSFTLLSIFENSLPGLLILVFNFYLLLHNWLNGFAEILRFADRHFYQDWWTATNFGTYFRTWNMVVQDWLFTYIYKDMYEIVTPKSKIIAKLMVLFVSAIIHEYLLCCMLRVFFPVLFVLFFFLGTILTFVQPKHPIFNALFLYAIALGNSLQLTLYTMEYYARGNCPIQGDNITAHLAPRIITSDCSYSM